MSNIKRSFIDPKKCKVCPECKAMASCPASAIAREDIEDPPYVEPICVGCAKCTKVCPNMAIQMI